MYLSTYKKRKNNSTLYSREEIVSSLGRRKKLAFFFRENRERESHDCIKEIERIIFTERKTKM